MINKNTLTKYAGNALTNLFTWVNPHSTFKSKIKEWSNTCNT